MTSQYTGILKWFYNWQTIATGALAIAAAFIAAFPAWGQLKVLKKQLEASVRPILIITQPELRDPDQFVAAPHIYFEIKNASHNEAIINRAITEISTKPNTGNVLTLTEKRTSVSADELSGILEAGETLNGNRVKSALLTPDDVSKVRNGNLILWVKVTVEWTDTVGNGKPLQRRFHFNPHAGGTFTRENTFVEAQ